MLPVGVGVIVRLTLVVSQPFFLSFQVTPDAKLVRLDTNTPEELFPANDLTCKFVGIAAKAIARLGEPAQIVTEKWMASAECPLAQTSCEKFNPLEWCVSKFVFCLRCSNQLVSL
jgi:hypothetical protein